MSIKPLVDKVVTFVKKLTFVEILAITLVVGVVAFVTYGLRTQCPDVAIYVYCHKP